MCTYSICAEYNGDRRRGSLKNNMTFFYVNEESPSLCRQRKETDSRKSLGIER